jgi:hypothetical protein
LAGCAAEAAALVISSLPTMRPGLHRLLLLAAACAAPVADPTADLALLLGGDSLAVLLAIDRLEQRAQPDVAPYLLALQTSSEKPLELRARAAAALAALGFASGEDFCLAVLTANLEEFAASDRQHGLPQDDRWAFPREIAVEPLRRRLQAAGRTPPAYDVNFGAPDLAAAGRRFASELALLPAQRPAASAADLAQRLPETPPPGWEAFPWRELRQRCLHDAR